MKPVLLINPNSSQTTTAAMLAIARRSLPLVEGWTNAKAPEMIVDPAALAAAADQLAAAALPDARAVIVAAFGDPGADALAGRLGVPVMGIGAAAARAAAEGGARFAVATTTPKLEPAIDRLMQGHGGQAYVGCFLTKGEPLALSQDPETLDRELAAACAAADAAGADRVIIGGGPLAEAAIRLAHHVRVPLVQPLPTACAEIAAM